MKYQTDYLNTLSYIRGETTVPAGANLNRKEFIQRTLDEIYRGYRWPFNNAVATVTLTNKSGTMPADFAVYHEPFVRFLRSANDVVEYQQVNITEKDDYVEGDNIYWLIPTGAGTFTIGVSEPVSEVEVIYQKLTPTVSAVVGSEFEDTMTVALGANRYMKMSDDPNADIAQDDAVFQQQLEGNIAAYNSATQRRRLRSRQSISGYYTGRK